MAIDVYDFIAGNTLPILQVEITNKQTGVPVPLAGLLTATLSWSIDGGSTVSKAMTVLAGLDNGTVEYQFGPGDLVAGTMSIQVVITEISTGFISTTVNGIKKIVGPSL